MGAKARVVNRKQVDVKARSDPGCHGMYSKGAPNETVESISLSTVARLPLLSRQCFVCAVLWFVSGEADARGKAGGVADWTDLLCVHTIK